MPPAMTSYPASELNHRHALLGHLQTAARGITLPLYQNGMTVMNKAGTGYDPVTNADMNAERKLRALILEACPDDHIAGEEFDDVTGTTDWLWTLDPIDGTRAFVAGVPVWSTLIALSYKSAPVLGLIDHPALNVSYWGAPGKAWKIEGETETSIKTSSCSALSEAILGCTEPLAMFHAGQLAAYNVIRRGTRFSRLGLDAFGYSLISEGRIDIIIEADLKPCDVRALIPVIEGAGGAITNWHGGSCIDGGAVVAVGDAGLLPELYTYLGRAMTP